MIKIKTVFREVCESGYSPPEFFAIVGKDRYGGITIYSLEGYHSTVNSRYVKKLAKRGSFCQFKDLPKLERERYKRIARIYPNPYVLEE